MNKQISSGHRSPHTGPGRRHAGARRLAVAAAAAATAVAGSAAWGANTTYVIPVGSTGNFSATTLTPPGTPGAGDILSDQNVSSPTAFNLALDENVTVGTILLNTGGAHSGTFTSDGNHFFTLDNTGGTITNIFGDTNASIGESANAGTLSVGPGIVIANTNLDVGATASANAGNGSVNITGNVTALTAQTLNLLGDSAGGDSISGTIGATGAGIAIVNNGTGANGGAGNAGAFTLSGVLGPNITSLTQSSAKSALVLTNAASVSGLLNVANGTLFLENGGSLTNVGSLAGAGAINTGPTGTGANIRTLVAGYDNTSTTFSGTITEGTNTRPFALTKTGTGTLTLTGTDAYGGNTTLGNGTLALDFTAAGAPASNIIAAGLNGSSGLVATGGRLQVIGAAGGSTQAFRAAAVTFGGNVIAAAPVAGGTIPTVTLGTLTDTQGGLIRFDGPATNTGASSGTTAGGTTQAATATITATTNTLTGGLIANNTATDNAGAYATVGLYDWAAISNAGAGTASSGTIVGGSQNAGFYTVANGNLPATFGANIDLTASGALAAGGSSSASYETIRFNTNASITLAPATSTAGSVVSALLVTPNVGANNTFVSGSNVGFIQASRKTGGAPGFTVWQNNVAGELSIFAALANGSSSAATSTYVQGGPGTVLMNAVNTYTGASFLDGGTTVVTAYSGLGGGSAPTSLATVNLGGGTLFANARAVSTDFSSSVTRFVFLGSSGGTLAAATGDTLTVGGTVGGGTPTAPNGPLTIGTGTLAGTGTGTANTTAVVGNGTVVLTGANNYAGGTVLNAGTLQINGINALGGGFYGGVTFNGGTLQYAPTITNGTSDISVATGSGRTSSVTIAAGGGTIDTNGNAVTFGSAIGNGGTGALTKIGAGTLTLAGANTYSGGTNITAGTVQATSAVRALGTGTTTVSGTGVLAGTGNTGGAVVINGGGTITAGPSANAGDTPGKLTTGGEMWNSNGQYIAKVAAATGTPGTASDLLVMSGLTVGAGTGSSAFSVTALGSGVTLSSGGQVLIATDTNTSSPSATNPFTAAITLGMLVLNTANTTVQPASGTDTLGLMGVTENGVYDLYLTDTAAAPEPTSLLLAGLAAAPLALGRRRRRRMA